MSWPFPELIQLVILPFNMETVETLTVSFEQIKEFPMDIISGIESADTKTTAAVSEQAPAKTMRRK
jgi:hypothetical protein